MVQVRQKGSHRQFKNDSKTGFVTIAYHSLMTRFLQAH
ncbi:type II toxin-antitoxin system HicA family toxin [Spirosoma telluris]